MTKKIIYLAFIVLSSCNSITSPEKEFLIPEQIESFLNDTSTMVNLNREFKVRDSILGININWDTKSGGVVPYKDLDVNSFTALLRNKFIDPNEYQNESPSVRAFYFFMAKYPFALAHGYAVSPDREDYRVSIEGLFIPKEYVTNSVKEDFYNLCKDADEYHDSDDLYSWWD
jgi:hypothetical protein